MRWTVHGERDLYESPWVRLSLVDVEVPGHRRYEHHVVHAADAAGTLVHDPDRGVLLLWRHRFLADEWGWEIPGGLVDDGESPEEAARRECIEESGWEPGPLRASYRFRPIAGLSTQTFHVFTATTAEHVGDPDPTEAERVDWLPLDAVRAAVNDNRVHDAMSVIAVLQLLAGA
jgi:8-oxo-dGTP pyrophosphatase MutT (NUDIX family)